MKEWGIEPLKGTKRLWEVETELLTAEEEELKEKDDLRDAIDQHGWGSAQSCKAAQSKKAKQFGNTQSTW